MNPVVVRKFLLWLEGFVKKHLRVIVVVVVTLACVGGGVGVYQWREKSELERLETLSYNMEMIGHRLVGGTPLHDVFVESEFNGERGVSFPTWSVKKEEKQGLYVALEAYNRTASAEKKATYTDLVSSVSSRLRRIAEDQDHVSSGVVAFSAWAEDRMDVVDSSTGEELRIPLTNFTYANLDDDMKENYTLRSEWIATHPDDPRFKKEEE